MAFTGVVDAARTARQHRRCVCSFTVSSASPHAQLLVEPSQGRVCTLLALLAGPVPVRDPIPAQINPHRELKHTSTHTTTKIVRVWRERRGVQSAE